MTPLLLTADELAAVTGLRRPSAQIRWLRARRIRHHVNAAGHPVVCRAWLVGGEEVQIEQMPARPNLKAISEAA